MNVYDFDKTIYVNDSTLDFFKYCLKKNKKIALLFPSYFYYACKYKLSKDFPLALFKEKFYRFLEYVDAEKEVEEFWKTHKSGIKKWYIDKQKEDDVIISASPEFLLKPICRDLGIKYLIASNIDVRTGKSDGVNCKGEVKVTKFRELFGDSEIDEFYSDSASDMPLVRISKYSMRIDGEKLYKWE